MPTSYHHLTDEQKRAQVVGNKARRLRMTPEHRARELEAKRESNRRYREKAGPELAASERQRSLASYKQRRLDPQGRVRLMLSAAKKRAKARGLAFDLTPQDIFIPEICPVLGVPIHLDSGRKYGVNAVHSPSLDRFDSALGYVRGNVRVISHRANVLKNNATLLELERIVAYMRGDL